MYRLLHDVPRFFILFQGQFLLLISPTVEHGLVGVYTILVYNVRLIITLVGDDKLVF